MASCVGAGSLLACILNEGVHSIEVEQVEHLLELFRKCYSNPFPSIVHLGGILGVVNALGAGAGNLIYVLPLSPASRDVNEEKGHSHILGPLLSSLACEQRLTTLVQEMFLLAQNSDNHQLQQYAAWGISFLRYYLWSKELPGLDSSQADVARTKSVPQSVPDDSVVMKLGQWLKYLNFSRTESMADVGTGKLF
ncbi:protein RST1 isoform X2 [Carica papaya]|uniref:protein RST1 isoform X2 n=1 Tax=Carica papaya TaxID=3649 RepID=UPI000B8CF899|nr:protein RST1 isoform X2 [Carica papaya]